MIWNLESLIEQFNYIRPAYSHVGFGYKYAEFSRAFSRQSSFDAIQHYDGTIFPGGFGADFDTSFELNNSYDGMNYSGSFGKDFGIDFDIQAGGDFVKDDFGLGFCRPM